MKKTTLLLCALVLAPVAAYAQSAGRTECVGYHLVDLPAGVLEAATEPVNSNAYRQIGGGEFSETLRVMEDGFDSGELTVEVSHPTTRDQFERYIPGKMSIDHNDGTAYLPSEIRYAKDRIELIKEIVAESEERLANKSSPDPEVTRDAIKDHRKTIASLEAQVKAWESIPEIWVDKNSYYYDGWLWLWRAPRIFRLRLNKEAIPEDKTRQELTLALVPRFQPRALGEVPAVAGFCVPYGFVKGVSTHPYRSQTTMRMQNEPGLLYTVRFQSDKLTGIVANIGYGPETANHRTVSEPVKLGTAEATLSGWRAAPFKETKLPNGRYRVEKKGKDGKPETFERTTSQGEVFAFKTTLSGKKDDPTQPAVMVLFNAFSFNADPIMKGRPVKPLEEAMPEFKQFLGSIRLREENEKAFKGVKK